jgi:hypothetical protein
MPDVGIINNYFSSLTFYKLGEKSDPSTNLVYGVYGAKIYNQMLGVKKNYILVFVPSYLAVLAQAPMHKLPWVNIQTRVLQDSAYPHLKPQNWVYEKNLEDPMFNLLERTEQHSSYNCPLFSDIEMKILHDPRKNTMYQYYNRMSLSASLSTMNCVITNKGNVYRNTRTHETSPIVIQPIYDQSFYRS